MCQPDLPLHDGEIEDEQKEGSRFTTHTFHNHVAQTLRTLQGAHVLA